MEIPKFSERCSMEATRDAVFLFQRRVLNCVAIPSGWEFEDGVFTQVEDECGDPIENGRELSPLEAYEEPLLDEDDRPCILAHWQTERVWLSREEATAWGEAKHYNYREGWRVYCVCAEGELAKLLKDT